MAIDDKRRQEIVNKLQEAGEHYQQLMARRRTLLNSIADAYKRQATNRGVDYRDMQMSKVNAWLEELSKMFEEHPQLWTAE
jgi:hypothetical protein